MLCPVPDNPETRYPAFKTCQVARLLLGFVRRYFIVDIDSIKTILDLQFTASV